MKNPYQQFLITVRHPAGIKVSVPLKSLANYTRSLNRMHRFWWKAEKTARLLEKANRLSLSALSDYYNITDPYLTLGAEFQASSQPEHSDAVPRSEASDVRNVDT